MYHKPLLISAKLSGPLAGDAPRLDALLEYVLSLHHAGGVPGHKVDRRFPAPPQGDIEIPLRREWLGPWLVARCSDPILAACPPGSETVEHVGKRVGVEHAGLLGEDARVVVATTNSWTKNYRIPLRIRLVPEVRWFAVGDHGKVLGALCRVNAIGKKVADGYGRVARWRVRAAGEDRSWYAATGHGPLLMRTLPDGPWLPPGLVGARRGFGAATCPYWHPERYTDILIPA